MNIRFLETFIWVAKLRSFKAAANKLNVSQATISGRIAALEQDVGHALLQRSHRESTITESGAKIMQYAQSILDTERALRDALKNPSPLSGLVRLGLVESVLHSWFPSFILELQKTHSDIEIEITVESTRRLHDLIRKGGLDVALQTDPVVSDGIRNRDLGSLAMGWISSDASSIPAFLPAERLLAVPIITFTRGSQPHLHLEDLIEHSGAKRHRLHFVSSITASCRLIEAGVGIATLPVAAVPDALSEQRYKQIHSDAVMPDLKLVASWRPDPVAGLAEAVIALALREMGAYAMANPTYASPPLDSEVLLL